MCIGVCVCACVHACVHACVRGRLCTIYIQVDTNRQVDTYIICVYLSVCVYLFIKYESKREWDKPGLSIISV